MGLLGLPGYSLAVRSELDLDLDAGGNFYAHQGFHGLLGGAHDVDEALVRAALELLTAVLVLVDGTQDRDDLGLGGQRDRPGDLCIRALGCLDDGFSGLDDQLVILGLEANADHVLAVACHWVYSFSYVLSGGIGHRLIKRMRTHKAGSYTHPCVSGRVRKTNRHSSRSAPRPRDIRVERKASAARLRTGEPVPDILHGSYLAMRAISRFNAYVRSRARFINIPVAS